MRRTTLFPGEKSIVRAGLLASYPMWGSIVIAPIVGLLIDRIGHKWVFVAVGCGGTALFLYLIPEFNQHAAYSFDFDRGSLSLF